MSIASPIITVTLAFFLGTAAVAQGTGADDTQAQPADQSQDTQTGQDQSATGEGSATQTQPSGASEANEGTSGQSNQSTDVQTAQDVEDAQAVEQQQTAPDSGENEPAAGAQSAAEDQEGQEQQTAEAEDSLKIYFSSGAAAIDQGQSATLDQAARLFREGQPYVMILSGVADTVGPADLNLDLSVARAQSVANGLQSRGIPVDRLQVIGRGNTDLPVNTGPGVAEPENRVVLITWR